MPFPVPALHIKLVAAPSAIVQVAAREDVLWNRPIFKAPPLAPPVPVTLSLHSAAGSPRSARAPV
jgi:hypothetical protein